VLTSVTGYLRHGSSPREAEFLTESVSILLETGYSCAMTGYSSGETLRSSKACVFVGGDSQFIQAITLLTCM
jgi:hypothetical protein